MALRLTLSPRQGGLVQQGSPMQGVAKGFPSIWPMAEKMAVSPHWGLFPHVLGCMWGQCLLQ